jgi:hypothetical protein
MDIPVYTKGDETTQENYQRELNQILRDGAGPDGNIISSVTNAQLTTNVVIAPDGSLTSLSALMPDGTIWYVSDAAPDPVFVGKINGALRQFTTTAYP